LRRRRIPQRFEPLAGEEQSAIDVARREQTVVAEPDESVGQYVEQEAADEF
jgi:hypothetical protein